MVKTVLIFAAGLLFAGCADFADVLGARPQSSGYAQNATRPEGMSRVDRRVDLRTSEEIPSSLSEEDTEIETEGVKSAADFIWPVDGGIVTSRFGVRKGRSHDGIDISAPRGTPVKAVSDGKVVYAGRFSGYGNLIVVKHAQNMFSAYAHSDQNKVSKGDKVKQGEVIATVGRTGRASGPHCHFEIRQKTEPRNPLYFLPKSEAYAAGN